MLNAIRRNGVNSSSEASSVLVPPGEIEYQRTGAVGLGGGR